MEDLRHWAEEIIDSGGFAPVERVVERLEGGLPEKVYKRQLTGAADALARLSIGMAPDPRFALRGPKVGEPVVLFRLPEGIAALEDVSNAYRKALVGVAMGGFVAHSDGRIAARERAALEAPYRGLPCTARRAPSSSCQPPVDTRRAARPGAAPTAPERGLRGHPW